MDDFGFEQYYTQALKKHRSLVNNASIHILKNAYLHGYLKGMSGAKKQ